MEKLGVLSEGVTPCDVCGSPSDTMIGGRYLCTKHDTSKQKQAEAQGIQHTFRRSIREMVLESDDKIKVLK